MELSKAGLYQIAKRLKKKRAKWRTCNLIKVTLEVTSWKFSFFGTIAYYITAIPGIWFNMLSIFYHCGYVGAGNWGND